LRGVQVATRPVGHAPPSPADSGRALHRARLTGSGPLVLPRAALSPAGQAGSHRRGPQLMLVWDPVGEWHTTVFSGPPPAGHRGLVAAPGREERPAGGGGGGSGGLPLGPAPVNSRVCDLPPACFPQGGDQPCRAPPGAPTGGPRSGWRGPLSSFPPGPECGRCGRFGHKQHECSVMEVGQVVQVAAASVPAPGLDGRYQILVKVQGGIHQALLDSGRTLDSRRYSDTLRL